MQASDLDPGNTALNSSAFTDLDHLAGAALSRITFALLTGGSLGAALKPQGLIQITYPPTVARCGINA